MSAIKTLIDNAIENKVTPLRVITEAEKEIATLKKQLAEKKTCEWGKLGDGEYETSCNDSFLFGEGTPKRNGFIHCPKCGGLIVAYKRNSKENKQ